MNRLINLLYNYNTENGKLSTENISTKIILENISLALGKDTYIALEDLLSQFAYTIEIEAYEAGFSDALHLVTNK